MTNIWIKVKLKCQKKWAEPISDLLSDLGALSVTFENDDSAPIIEPKIGNTSIWEQNKISAFFTPDADFKHIFNSLKDSLPKNTFSNWEIEEVEEQDWQRLALDLFKPIECGHNLWICPSWHTPPRPDSTNLMIDPGLAFGTGLHPTTFMCLQWIDQHAPLQKVNTVIDFGCGSGIVGLSALLLGAQNNVAVDIDPQAIDATLSNAKLNNLNSKVATYLPEQLPSDEKCDLLIANIITEILVELKTTLINHLKPGATLVLSGILNTQEDRIKDTFGKHCEYVTTWQREEWLCMEFKKV